MGDCMHLQQEARNEDCPILQEGESRFLFPKVTFLAKLWDLKCSSKSSQDHSTVVLPSQKSNALPT